jgi:hypothetical protein
MESKQLKKLKRKVSMKFLIPSKQRPEKAKRVSDLFGVDKCIVYVHESEKEEYASVLSCELRTHNKHGMGAIRKQMLQENLKEEYLFMLDDDIEGIEYKFTGRFSVDTIVETEHLQEIIQNLYQASVDLKTPLFGFMSAPTPFLYTQIDMVHFSGMIAAGIGIIPELLGDIMFDERLIVNEDQDFCLQVKFYKRYFFMDNRYNFRYGVTWTAKGGCSTLRNNDTMIKCREILTNKYGHRVVAISGKKENQHVLKVEF